MLIEEGKGEKWDVGRLCSGEVQRSWSRLPFMPCLCDEGLQGSMGAIRQILKKELRIRK